MASTGAGDEDWLRGLARESDVALDETMSEEGGAVETVSPDDLPVLDVANYRVIGELAKGGMGRILIAEDRRLRRIVALKELLAPNSALARRFVEEAFITAQLQHPSIVPIHEAGRWPSGAPFYAMKLIAGRPLADLVREARTLPERLALVKHVTAVAEALAYAHRRRVIHRDIKPANVIVGSFGETMVIDWGLARNLARGDDGLAGSVAGTPAFMPPEQAAGEPVDERADVFAIGAMLYTVLAGRPPYEGTDSGQVISSVLAGPPPPLARAAPGCPEELLTIVDKAMARRRDDRYPSAQELARELEQFLTGRLVSSHTYSTWTLVRRWIARHRVAVGVAAAALVVLGVGGALAVARVVGERDRADRERAVAQQERAVAEEATRREAARVEQLTLTHARVGLDSDPTAAIAWIKRIDPSSPSGPAARQLAAQAYLLGVASHLIVAGEGGLVAATISPDGRRVATGDDEGVVRLWDVSAADPRLAGETRLGGAVDRVWFLADGTLVACGGGGARVLGGQGPSLDAEGPPLAGDVSDLAATPDGRWLAVAAGGQVRLWEVGARRIVGAVASDGRPARVVVAPGGRAVAWRDGRGVRVWTVAAGRPVSAAAPPAGDGSIAFSRDGRLVAAGSPDVAVVWETATGREIARLAAPASMSYVAFSPIDDHLASSGDDATVRVWDLATRTAVTLSPHSTSASRLTLFSPDGTRVVATRDESARVIDVTGAHYRKLRGITGSITAAAFDGEGRRLVLAGNDGDARVFDVVAGGMRVVRLAPAGARAISAAAGDVVSLAAGAAPCGDVPAAGALLARSGDGRILAFAAQGGGVVVCEGGTARASWTGEEATALALNGDGSLAALAVGAGTLQLRRLADAHLDTALLSGGAVTAVAVSSDGTMVAALARDRRLWIWSPGAPPRPLAGGVDRFALAPDGRAVATLEGATLRVRDSAGGAVTRELPAKAITALAFTPRGELVLGKNDGLITVVDPGGGGRTLTDDGGEVARLDASPDGRAIASLDAQGTARFFPVDTPTDPAAFRGWLEALTNAVVDPAGELVPRPAP